MNNGKAIAAYWEATFRGKLSASEVVVFETVLAVTAPEDAQKAIDDVASTGGYPPTPQRIAELAEPHRMERARLRMHDEKALPPGNRAMSFAVWLREYATEEEKAIVRKVSPGLTKKFGADLGGLDSV